MAEQASAPASGGSVDDKPTSEPKRSDFSGLVPQQREYREIPATIGMAEWDRVPQIRSILRELETNGLFYRAGLLSVLQERDDRLSGCWGIRTDTLLGVPLEFEPALIDGRVTPESEEVADAAEVDWPKMFPEGSLAQLFKQGRDLGLSIGELVVSEDPESGRWIPKLKTWRTQWVWWNWGTESYWLNTSGAYDEDGNPTMDGAGVIELPRIDREIYSDGHWVIYTPGGYRYAFQRGLIRATAMLRLKRQWDFRDWSRFNEVYGLMIRLAETPAGASEEDKTRFANSIRNMGSEPTVEAPTAADGSKYGLTIVSAPSGTGAQTFGDSLHYIDECIGNIILGQQASGEKKSSLGSGDDNQNESVRQDILEKDARMFGVLKAQCLSWWCLWNFGTRALCPTPAPVIDPPDTSEKKADRYLKAGQAIEALNRALAGRADVQGIADDLGVPLLAEGETPFNPPPVLGTDETDEDGAEEKPEGLRALSVKPAPLKPRYIDKLATSAVERGTSALAPYLAEIKRAVRDAKSPEELRVLLLERFRSADPSKFADVVERANVMAALEGRHDVIDGL